MNDGLFFDVLDEEELREQLDMYLIIVFCVNEEFFFIVDQVIEEIEEMMQELLDLEDDEIFIQLDWFFMFFQEIQIFKRFSMSSYEE